MDNSPEKRMSLVDTLKTVGLAVDVDGKTDWLRAGNFNLNDIKPYDINLSNATEFWNPDGTSHTTLVTDEANENFVKLLVDFSEHKPLYVGYAVKLGHKDWTGCYDNDNSISFSVYGSPEIKNIVLEVKGENQTIIAKKKITVTNNNRIYKFKLKDLSDFSNEFAKMSELVFLFTAENVDGKGFVEISNLKIS
jgi:hypothetical protein